MVLWLSSFEMDTAAQIQIVLVPLEMECNQNFSLQFWENSRVD